MKNIFLKEITCRCCGLFFYVCQSCWKGQLYCCDYCRRETRRKQHNASQKRYRDTEKGKKSHREDEKKRRKKQKSEKTMDDRGSTVVSGDDIESKQVLHTSQCCHFCGKSGTVVSEFPHREYGGKYSVPVFADTG